MLPFSKTELSYKQQLLVLFLLVLGLNFNTLFNDYALDDIVVMTENKFVEQGIRGIPEILRTDYIAGHSTESTILSGARYRPLALVSFALEHQFFGAQPAISHLINLLLYGLLIAVLFTFLKMYLPKDSSPYLAFFTCLLFVAHPVHTEVTANVKSRDEILTFLFITLSLTSCFRSIDRKNKLSLFAALFWFLLALLTKETAVTMLGILPLSLYFFRNEKIKSVLTTTLPFLLVFSGYMILRYFLVGFKHYPVADVTNSPYIYASATEAFATKMYVLWKYILLLLFPYSLTTEYGYNQVPYIGIVSAPFVLSGLLVSGLLLFSLSAIRRRSIYSFCILFFFATLSVGSNFLFDLGTTMAERMLFLPSLGYCLALASLFLSIQTPLRGTSAVVISAVLVLFSIKTIARNAEWKNNETLFLADIVTSPGSARMNLYACEQYILKANNTQNLDLKNKYLDQAILYGETSLRIHSKFAYTYLRVGLACFHRGDYFRAADYWKKGFILEPNNPETKKWASYLSTLLNAEGNRMFERGSPGEAIRYYRKAADLYPENTEAWYNLGGTCYAIRDTLRAMEAWEKVKQLSPGHRFLKEEFILPKLQ